MPPPLCFSSRVRLPSTLIRRKINEKYVRIFGQAVEYNSAAIWCDIKGPHYRRTAQSSQPPRGLSVQNRGVFECYLLMR